MDKNPDYSGAGIDMLDCIYKKAELSVSNLLMVGDRFSSVQ